jgi:plasmid stabilization system protein ParE
VTLEVRLRPEAEQDLADAATWYEEQRQGLGHEFLDEVLTLLTSIAETPLMYPDVHRNTSRAVSSLSVQCLFSVGGRDNCRYCGNAW